MITKDVAIQNGQFVVAMPDQAPALGFDPSAESFSWRDVLPSNYWNLDLLEEKVAVLGGNPILTPARIVIKPIEDPELPESAQDLTPRIVLEFAENVPALVFNKTRCMLATKLTGTPNPALWAERLPTIELYAGAYREMAAAMQILFRPVAASPNMADEAAPVEPVASETYTMEDANDDLF